MNRPARWDAWFAVTRLERKSDRSVAVGLLRPPELRDPHLSVLLDEIEVDVVALLQLGRGDVVLELGRVVPVERPLVALFAPIVIFNTANKYFTTRYVNNFIVIIKDMLENFLTNNVFSGLNFLF